MEQTTTFKAAFDKRNNNPLKNYGVGGVLCTMMLKGDKGAVQFVFDTAMHLPHVVKEWEGKNYQLSPMGFSVDYHSPEPMYKGQKPRSNECSVLKGCCYSDGSSLLAEQWFNTLLHKGSDAVWFLLQTEYHERFGTNG